MFDQGESSTYACCTIKQLGSLEKSLTLSKAVLVRCPSCAYNFAHLHCINTCSPNQSQTVKVTRVMNVTEQNRTREAVLSYQAFISKTFADTSFQSCKNVRIPATIGGYAIATMCGRYGSKLCTPQRWYDFQGDSSNGLAPLDIDFKIIQEGDTTGLPEGVIPYNGVALMCNETTPTGGDVCSCQDCQESCPSVLPPSPVAGPFTLLGTNGYLVISIILLILLILSFVLYLSVSWWVASQKNKKKGIHRGKGKDKDSDKVTEKIIHPSEVTCAETNSLAAQAYLSSQFRIWGTIMASYPLTVSTLIQ